MKHLTRAAVVSVAAAALLGLAAPAHALPAPTRALPDDGAMYALGCDGGDMTLQLFAVDESNASSTPIGTPNNDATCAGQGAWNAKTETAYWLGWGEGSFLAQVDLATGQTTDLGQFTIDGVAVSNVHSIAIGLDGSAFAIATAPSSATALYSLDLASAEIELIAPTDTGLYGFAVNPVTGKFYVVDYDGVLSRIDVKTGELTTVGTYDLDIDGHGTYPYSLQIDSAGIAWIENDGVDADLWSAQIDDVTTAEFHGVFQMEVDGIWTNFYHEALLVTYDARSPKGEVSKTKLVADGEVEVTGSGFLPGEEYEIWVHSTPTLLATGVADDDGAVSALVALPNEIEAGDHEIEIRGAISGSVFMDIVVLETLAATGVDASGALAAGLGLLVLGSTAALAARSRARGTQRASA